MDILCSEPILKDQPHSIARIFNIIRFGPRFKSIDSMLGLRFERYLYISGKAHEYRKDMPGRYSDFMSCLNQRKEKA